jgi:hypothetical protein
MFRALAIAAAALAICATSANAKAKYDTFTCVGELTYNNEIVAHEGPDSDNPMTCMIDRPSIRERILAVCSRGDGCIVRAKGRSGNGNYYSIEEIISVRSIRLGD